MQVHRSALFFGLLLACALPVLGPACGGDLGNPFTGFPPVAEAGADVMEGDSNAAVPAPFGLDTRPANPRCVAPPRAIESTGIRLEPVYPALTFDEPVLLLTAPGDRTRVFVVEKKGIVRVFSNTPGVATTSIFIDIRARVSSASGEAGLLGMAFDPAFAANGRVYLSYTGHGGLTNVDLLSLVSRFTSGDGGRTLDASTETTIFGPLEQPFENHNGGNIAFGPDGLLYMGFGDGGDGSDPKGNGQNVDVFFGKMLRVDVRSGTPYGIPPDNPFADGGGKKEIFALGLRNPWRWSFDKKLGELWLGDVGEDTFEEIDKIELGGNYGWSVREGQGCLTPAQTCRSEDLIAPVISYRHDDGSSVTGGYVYRGNAIPDLVGTYVYGDFSSGNIWGLFKDALGDKLAPRLLNAGGPNPSIASFGQDEDGELYVVDFATGKILQIVSAAGSKPVAFPQTLSATGCFDPADVKNPGPSLIPYGVNAALWSDGTQKDRFFAIPDGEKIAIADDGDLDLPPGSVTLKTFFLGGRRIETRYFVRHEDGGWAGYTYEWNDAQTDATLLADDKTKRVWDRDWYFLTRAQCLKCHTKGSGGTLGLELAQLNGDFVYPNHRRSNQIATLQHLGLFEVPPPDDRPRLADPRAQGPLADRARAYLHSNCSMCHRPGTGGQGPMDFRVTTPLREASTCNEDPQNGTLGIAGAKILVPGDPSKSLISARMHAAVTERMPPLASQFVDLAGTKVVDDWIRSLKACP